MRGRLQKTRQIDLTPVAGNGLLDRRAFLRGGAAMAATISGYTLVKNAAAEPLKNDPWSLTPGAITKPYETRSRFEEKIARTLTNPKGETRVQNARTRCIS
jgi:sulfane dehydrogenase subunit SoxC